MFTNTDCSTVAASVMSWPGTLLGCHYQRYQMCMFRLGRRAHDLSSIYRSTHDQGATREYSFVVERFNYADARSNRFGMQDTGTSVIEHRGEIDARARLAAATMLV